MIERDELINRLISDLKTLKLPVDEVYIDFRNYSKCFYGRYYPVSDKRYEGKVVVYLYKDKHCSEFMKHTQLLETLIHEMVHHIQYSDPSFKRVKGVMHNTEFWRLYNHYMNRAEDRLNIKFGEVRATKHSEVS